MELGPHGRSPLDWQGRRSARWLCALACAWMCILGAALADDADDLYSAGERHFSAQRWIPAADAFDQFSLAFPQDERAGAARFRQGEALVAAKKYDAARTCLEAYLTTQPTGPYAKQAQFRLGEVAYFAGDRAEARSQLQKFRERFPNDALNAYTLLYLGEIELDFGRPDQAQAMFAAGIRDHNDGPTAMKLRLGVGNAYLKQREFASALRHYQYVAAYGGALADEGRVQAGVAYFQQGEPEVAAQILTEIQNAPIKTGASAKAAYWLAKMKLAQQQPREAAAIAEEALEFHAIGEGVPQLKYVAGEAWKVAGDRPAAMRHFASVADDHPENDWADDARYLQIVLAFEVRDYDAVDRTAVAFERAAPNSQYSRAVRLLQCRALLKVGRFEEAETAAEDLLIALGDQPAAIRRIVDVTEPRGRPTEIAAGRFCLAAAKTGLKNYSAALTLLGTIEANQLPADMIHDFIGAKAAALQGVGNHRDAVAILRSHLQHHAPGKELVNCHSLLVLALVEAGSWNEAVAELVALRKAHEDEGEVAVTTLEAAERAYFAGQAPMAVTFYEKLIRHNDHAHTVAQAKAGLAWAKLAANPAKVSDKTFQELLEKYPDSRLAPQTMLIRGRTLEQRRDFEPAVHLYEQLVERFPRSKQAPDALLAAARLCSDLGSHRDAIELLSRLTEGYPNFAHLDAVYYLWGWSLIDLKRDDEGAALLTRLNEEFPRSRYRADTSFYLAQRAYDAGDYKQTESLLEKFETLDADTQLQIDALILRGRNSAAQEKWGEVVGLMHRALERQADQEQRLTAEFWTAEAEYRLGQYQAAERRLSRLENERGGKLDETSALVALRRAQALVQLRKWTEAYQIASDLADEYADFSQRHELDYLLGRCLLQQEKFDAARDALRAAAESTAAAKTETAVGAQWLIGECWFREKNYSQAIRAYLVCSETYKHQPRWQAAALLQAGKCFELQRDWAHARDTYESLLERFARQPAAEEARSRLAAVADLEQRGAEDSVIR